MTQPNPFSSASSYDHLVNPKIVLGATGYKVGVDIANVDTYYGTAVGSSGMRISDIWVNTIHANSYSPSPSAGIGPTGPPATISGGTGIGVGVSGGAFTISSLVNVQGSTYIGVQTNGSTFTLSSLTSITGSTFISVQSTGSTFIISYTGSGGGSSTGQTGVEGHVAFFTPTGLSSSSDVVYDRTKQILNIPALNVQTTIKNSGQVELSTFQGDCYIQSGLFNPPTGQEGNFFYISPFGEVATSALCVDTQNYKVGINTDNPKTYLDVQGQTEISYDRSFGDFPLLGGGTGSVGNIPIFPGSYTLNTWGAGGAANAGIYGGAGGASVTQISVGATGTLTWGPQGGSLGGGPATQVAYNGLTFLWVPGGGAGPSGGTGGAGGAAGGDGFPYPQGGGPGNGGLASITDPQSWQYTLPLNTGVTGGTFSSGSITSLTGSGSQGIVFTFSQPGIQNIVGTISTYTFSGPTSFTIANTSMLFQNTSFSSTSGTFNSGIIPNSVASTDGAPSSVAVTDSSFALFDPYTIGSIGTIQGNPQVVFNGSPTISSGNVTWTGGTYTSPTYSGYTLILNGSILDTGNRILTLLAPTQIIFGGPLGTFNGSFTTDANITIPAGSTININKRVFNSRGQTGGFQTSAAFGGGGYTGGGAPGRITNIFGYTGSYDVEGNTNAGGGPGTWGVSGVSGISIGSNNSYSGRGIFPYRNRFNPTIYGVGGSTGAAGPGYLAIENSNIEFNSPALIVNGGVKINGTIQNTLNLQSTENGLYKWAEFSMSNANPSPVSTTYKFIKGSDVGGGGINAGSLHLYRYGGSTYSFANPAFQGSPILEIGPIVPGSGTTGSSPNILGINANTTISGNVNISQGFYADASSLGIPAAPSNLNVAGNISAQGYTTNRQFGTALAPFSPPANYTFSSTTRSGLSGFMASGNGINNNIMCPPVGFYVGPNTLLMVTPSFSGSGFNYPINPYIYPTLGTSAATDPGYFQINVSDAAVIAPTFQYFWLNLLS